MMDLASSAMCALKQEALASDSYVGQNYETSLLAEIRGIPSNPTEWNDEDAQRWLRGCINEYQLCEEDLPPSLDMSVDNLLKGVNSVEFEKAFGDICGDVIANDFHLRMQMAECKARPTVAARPPICQPDSTSMHSVNTVLPRVQSLPRAPPPYPQQTVVTTFQPEPIPYNQFYPQLTAYQPQPTALYENHVINSSPSALGYPRTALPPMAAFRERVPIHSSSQSPADIKVFSYPSQLIVPEQMSPGLSSPGLSPGLSLGRSDLLLSPRSTTVPVHFSVPLSHTQRSGSLMSVSSVESNSLSDWTSEEEISPFVCSDPDDSLTTRGMGNHLLDGPVMNGALPTITLSSQSTGQQLGEPLGQFPDGTGIVAIPINPKTGKPKRKRRKKIRGQIIPPPLLPNRSSCTLWEFFLELLSDPEHYSRLITWLDHEKGEFKIIDSEVVSIIWGLLKNKTGMKYDHMSRSIRYYYGKDILDKVQDKQLVYRFGVGSNWLNYQRKSQGVDESRMPKTPIQICGRVAKPKHFAVARVAPTVS